MRCALFRADCLLRSIWSKVDKEDELSAKGSLFKEVVPDHSAADKDASHQISRQKGTWEER